MKGDTCGVFGKQGVQLRRDLRLTKDFLFRRQNGEESRFVPSGVNLLLVIVGREEDYDSTCVLSNVGAECLSIYEFFFFQQPTTTTAETSTTIAAY